MTRKINSVVPAPTELRFHWGQTFHKHTCEGVLPNCDECCEENVRGREDVLPWGCVLKWTPEGDHQDR